MKKFNFLHYYQEPMPDRWVGKVEQPPKSRFHEIVKCFSLEQALPTATERTFALLGFACDIGVKRHQGRSGAAQGPDMIRRALATLTWHRKPAPVIYDVGDIFCNTEELEQSQEALAEVIALLKQKNIYPLVMGGGNETTWGHYLGLMKSNAKLDIGIVNIDACLGLEDLLEGNRHHAGSPFWQIAQDRKKRKLNFEYAVLGVQSSSNTTFLLERAEALNTTLIKAETWQQEKEKSEVVLSHFLQCQDRVLLTICLDAFNSAFAPGVSLPQSLGIYPDTIIPLIRKIAESKKLFALEVVGLNPFYDVDQRTARLSANFIYEVINYFR